MAAFGAWAFVPNQDVSGTFPIGVLACDPAVGIDHVAISVNGGAAVNVTSRTWRSHDGSHIFCHVRDLVCSGFANGALTITGTVVPISGSSFTLPTITVYNVGGTGTPLNNYTRYVSGSGNDANSGTTSGSPKRSVYSAALSIRAAAATAGPGGALDTTFGGRIIHLGGDVLWGQYTFTANIPDDGLRWMRIEPNSGVSRASARIVDGNSNYPRINRLEIAGCTVDAQINSDCSTADSCWMHGSTMTGTSRGGRTQHPDNPADTGPIAVACAWSSLGWNAGYLTAHATYGRAEVTDVLQGMSGSAFCAGIDVHHITGEAFNGSGIVLDWGVWDILHESVPGWPDPPHTDGFWWTNFGGDTSPKFIQGGRASYDWDAQGLFAATGQQIRNTCVEGNVFRFNSGTAFVSQLLGGCSNVAIVNNTWYAQQFRIETIATSATVRLQNNFFSSWFNDGSSVQRDAAITSTHNHWGNAGDAFGSSSTTGSGGFTDPDHATLPDLRPAGGSALLASGTSITGWNFPADANGVGSAGSPNRGAWGMAASPSGFSAGGPISPASIADGVVQSPRVDQRIYASEVNDGGLVQSPRVDQRFSPASIADGSAPAAAGVHQVVAPISVDDGQAPQALRVDQVLHAPSVDDGGLVGAPVVTDVPGGPVVHALSGTSDGFGDDFADLEVVAPSMTSVVVDRVIARNRTTRVCILPMWCVCSFAKGAVRDLSKLRVTGPNGEGAPQGWEIWPFAAPKWDDGSYQNARFLATHAFLPLGTTEWEVRMEAEDPVVHPLSGTSRGVGEDRGWLLAGDDLIPVVHALSGTSAGVGEDFCLDGFMGTTPIVHALSGTSVGIGNDRARILKARRGQKPGDVTLTAGAADPLIPLTAGAIEREIHLKGEIGRYFPIGGAAAEPPPPASAATQASRYQVTKTRFRMSWEGDHFWVSKIEFQDLLLPDLHFWWYTVGASDLTVTDLTYELSTDLTLHPKAPGAELGVYFSDFNGAVRVLDGAGKLDHWRLAPAHLTFVEGQAIPFRGGGTNRAVDDIPVGIERESALAACENVIWCMSKNWANSGNFSWNGVVPHMPALWADENAARAYIVDRIAHRPRPVPPDPFFNGGLLGRRNREQGRAWDFGVTMGTWPAARLLEPLYLEAVWPEIMQEAWVRSMAHRREPPNGTDAAPPYRSAAHPLSWWYENGPHFGTTPNDFLGKLRQPLEEEIGNPGTGTGPGHGWSMLFQSHASVNYLTGAYLMTGDWQLEESIHDLCEQCLSQFSTSGPQIDRIDQGRAFARELLIWSELHRCTNREDVKARWRFRVLDTYPRVWPGGKFPGQRPVRPGWMQEFGFVGEIPPTIQAYPEALIVAGLYASLLHLGDVTNPNDPIRLMLNQIGETMVMYLWENVFFQPGRWFVPSFVAYNNGQIVSPFDTQRWFFGEEGYRLWSLGCSRLMAVLGADSPFNTGAAIRARAQLQVTDVPLDEEAQWGFGGTGGFGKYEDWTAVLP